MLCPWIGFIQLVTIVSVPISQNQNIPIERTLFDGIRPQIEPSIRKHFLLWTHDPRRTFPWNVPSFMCPLLCTLKPKREHSCQENGCFFELFVISFEFFYSLMIYA